MGRHQNQAVKRARERDKKLKAEDKRAKRQKRKDPSPDGVAPRDEPDSTRPADDGTTGEPPAASADGTRSR